jgi:hypothetical protein
MNVDLFGLPRTMAAILRLQRRLGTPLGVQEEDVVGPVDGDPTVERAGPGQ